VDEVTNTIRPRPSGECCGTRRPHPRAPARLKRMGASMRRPRAHPPSIEPCETRGRQSPPQSASARRWRVDAAGGTRVGRRVDYGRVRDGADADLQVVFDRIHRGIRPFRGVGMRFGGPGAPPPGLALLAHPPPKPLGEGWGSRRAWRASMKVLALSRAVRGRGAGGLRGSAQRARQNSASSRDFPPKRDRGPPPPAPGTARAVRVLHARALRA
jgi:hypothetical protein